MNAPPPTAADLSGESRARRCRACYERFDAMRPTLQSLAAGSGAKQRRSADLLQGMSLVMGIA